MFSNGFFPVFGPNQLCTNCHPWKKSTTSTPQQFQKNSDKTPGCRHFMLAIFFFTSCKMVCFLILHLETRNPYWRHLRRANAFISRIARMCASLMLVRVRPACSFSTFSATCYTSYRLGTLKEFCGELYNKSSPNFDGFYAIKNNYNAFLGRVYLFLRHDASDDEWGTASIYSSLPHLYIQDVRKLW